MDAAQSEALLHALVAACATGDTEAALGLIEELGQGVDVRFSVTDAASNSVLPIYNLSTPLAMALLRGHRDLARALLRRGANPHTGAVTSWTPLLERTPLLHCLCSMPNTMATLRLFLTEALGVDLDERARCAHQAGHHDGHRGLTPLEVAHCRGNVEAAALLLSAGADPRIVRIDLPRRLALPFMGGAGPVDVTRVGAMVKGARQEPKRLRLLHKARACHDAAAAVAKVVEDARKAGEISADMPADAAAAGPLRERCAATAPRFARSRLRRGDPLSWAELASAEELGGLRVEGAERFRAVVEFVVFGGLCPEHFVELKELLAPRWYDPREEVVVVV